jgi:hypothetical protein
LFFVTYNFFANWVLFSFLVTASFLFKHVGVGGGWWQVVEGCMCPRHENAGALDYYQELRITDRGGGRSRQSFKGRNNT